MTRIRLYLTGLLCLALLMPIPAEAASVPLDRILVVVNGGAITESALATRVRQVEQQLAAQHITPPPEAILKRQVLDRMILDKLQRQYAKRVGIKISKTDVEQAFNALAARNQLAPAAFAAALAKDGIDVTQFQRQLRTQLEIRQIVDRTIRPRVQITDRQVAHYLRRERSSSRRRYRVKDIFVPMSRTLPGGVQHAATQVHLLEAKLQGGQAFSELAIAYSQGPQALQGGDLGWKRGAQLPPAFVAVLKKMKVGDVSAPLQTAHGFHILKLVDEQSEAPAHVVTQSHVREILIKPNAILTAAAALQRVRGLRRQIKAGAHFAALARQDSDDPLSAAAGGDLGWVNPGELDPSIESALDGLSIHGLSQPVVTHAGVVLVQLLGRRQRDIGQEIGVFQARRALEERKASALYQRWLKLLHDHAYIRFVHAAHPS